MANASPQKVIINERAAARLRGGHVWVYASDVLNDAGGQPGALVHVIGPKSKILGSAIYSSSSQIRLRLPGLIVDRYNDVPTFQVLTQAWDRPERTQTIVTALNEFAQAEHIVERAD